MMRWLFCLMFVASVALPSTGQAGTCDSRRGVDKALCEARESATITPCETLGRDDRLHCFAIARRSERACLQIMDATHRARCESDVRGAPAADLSRPGVGHSAHAAPTEPTTATRTPPPRTATPSTTTTRPTYGSSGTNAGSHTTAAIRIPTSVPSSPAACSGANQEEVTLCKALAGRDVGLCGSLHQHDAKLYCFGVVRKSESSCRQVMDPGTEAQCLRLIR